MELFAAAIQADSGGSETRRKSGAGHVRGEKRRSQVDMMRSRGIWGRGVAKDKVEGTGKGLRSCFQKAEGAGRDDRDSPLCIHCTHYFILYLLRR